jgi:hypothetical protein
MEERPDLDLLELLARRLERLSADSKWAHRASGIRGQMLRALEATEDGGQGTEELIEAAFAILERAAREIA